MVEICVWKGFRFPAEENYFCPSLCVWTSSELHTASHPIGTWGPFRGAKAQSDRGADNSHPSSAEDKNE
jgi:hypothetical protein